MEISYKHKPFFKNWQFSYCKITFTILFSFAISISCKAQLLTRLTNPDITIRLTHPPESGIKVNKVAFGQATGTCADHIVDAAISDFVANNVEVVDRANLNAILAEHGFTLSGYVDKTSAAELGKILGPSALVFINVQTCIYQQDRLLDKETKKKDNVSYNVNVFIAKTKVFLKFSIRTVDLATGRIFAAQTFEYSPEKSNKSYDGYPEYPASFDVQEIAFKKAVWDIHKMLLKWTENKSLIFFDDKNFNLNEAYKALKDGDLERAFQLSKKNLQDCLNGDKTKDKAFAHANYNLGMCYFLYGDYDSALKYLYEADKSKSGGIISEAITECQKAKALSESMRRVEEKASMELTQSQVAKGRSLQAETANTLTNKSIIDMVQLKLPETIILQKIKNSKCNFETTPNALAVLTKAGIGEKILVAMIEKQ